MPDPVPSWMVSPEGGRMGRADDDEYVAFVQPRMPQLRRAAYLLCGDWWRGDDLVQRALTDAYVHWARVRRADSPDAYLRTILVHRFIDEQRAGWSRVKLVESPPEPGGDHGVEPAVSVDLRTALARLPVRQRAVLVLRFLCDMSVEQTAEAMNCSTGTVKSQTAHGLADLRAVLGGALDDVTGVAARSDRIRPGGRA